MKITAIRHTRVDVPAGICYGQSDVPLAKTYAEEMAAVKVQTDWYQFDAIYCSPLTRCRRLAEDLFPLEIIRFDDRLIELNFGEWEMHHWNEISETAEAKVWFEDFVNVRTPQGESFRDQINRTHSFLNDLKETNYQHIVLITHGGILRALDCLINKTEPLNAFRDKVDYGELIQFNMKTNAAK